MLIYWRVNLRSVVPKTRDAQGLWHIHSRPPKFLNSAPSALHSSFSSVLARAASHGKKEGPTRVGLAVDVELI